MWLGLKERNNSILKRKFRMMMKILSKEVVHGIDHGASVRIWYLWMRQWSECKNVPGRRSSKTRDGKTGPLLEYSFQECLSGVEGECEEMVAAWLRRQLWGLLGLPSRLSCQRACSGHSWEKSGMLQLCCRNISWVGVCSLLWNSDILMFMF